MHFLKDNSSSRKAIINNFKKATEIYLAIAFWGKGSHDVIKKYKNKNIKIICNLESGATNPNEIINIAKDIGYKNIRSNSNLHSKVYLTNNALVIGSSNFSSNGLSLEGNEINRLIEANVEIKDENILKIVEFWFNGLWKKSIKISKKYCDSYLKKWADNRSKNKELLKKYNFFKAYENGLYNNANIRIIVDITEFDDATEKLGKKCVKEQFSKDLLYGGETIDFWQNYKEIKRDAIVINYFFNTEKDEIDFQAFYHTLPKKYDKNSFQFCREIKDEIMSKKHINEIKKIIKQNKKPLAIEKNNGLDISLKDFYKKFRK